MCEALHVMCEVLHFICEADHFLCEALHILCEAQHIMCEAQRIVCEAQHIINDAQHAICESQHIGAPLWLSRAHGFLFTDTAGQYQSSVQPCGTWKSVHMPSRRYLHTEALMGSSVCVFNTSHLERLICGCFFLWCSTSRASFLLLKCTKESLLIWLLCFLMHNVSSMIFPWRSEANTARSGSLLSRDSSPRPFSWKRKASPTRSSSLSVQSIPLRNSLHDTEKWTQRASVGFCA